MAKLPTQGTDVYVSTDGSTVDKIACPMTIDMAANTADQVEVTCLSSQTREYVPGLPTLGAITITGAYDTTDTVYEKLLELAASHDVVPWFIGFSDSTAAPTITTGTMTPPPDRTGYSITGFISSMSPSIPQNNVVQYTLVIQPSVAPTFHKGTPPVGP